MYTRLDQKYETSYTALCNCVVKPWRSNWRYSAPCPPHMQKQMQTKCIHDLRAHGCVNLVHRHHAAFHYFYLRTETVVNAGDICTLQITFILITGKKKKRKTTTNQIWIHMEENGADMLNLQSKSVNMALNDLSPMQKKNSRRSGICSLFWGIRHIL